MDHRNPNEQMYVPDKYMLDDIDLPGGEGAGIVRGWQLQAYGLISTPARAPLRIIKNLRVFACRNAMKMVIVVFAWLVS